MTWSTRQLAELAGATVKTVRHYHEIGLLGEPDRAANGYKRYGVRHLVSLLRIRRLVDLGVPLSQIALLSDSDDATDTLSLIDAELAETVDRLQRIRVELASILRLQAPTDLPPGLDEVAMDLPDANRALILIYSHVFGPTAMAGLADMLQYLRRNPLDVEFNALSADAEENARAEFAVRYAPHVEYLNDRYPWISDPGAGSRKGSAFVAGVVGEAFLELFNPAQLDVLARVDDILHPREV